MSGDRVGSVLEFYENLADEYHLIFEDWRQDMEAQAVVLDRVIRSARRTPPVTVLDCACGIGTQAIGLALRGYTVHATDFSSAAVARAAAEAQALGVALTVGVADFRDLAQQVTGTFDVVMACDNVLAHLLREEDLVAALRQMGAKVEAGGLFLATMRDYDHARHVYQQTQGPAVDGPEVFHAETGKRLVFQLWDWDPGGHTYTMHHFIVQEDGQEWRQKHRVTLFRAWGRAELTKALAEAGFTEICWHAPEESGYYQPLVTAHKQ